MSPPTLGCPGASAAARAACAADPRIPLPRDGAERAVMLVLRFVAAAGDTGDAACWDAAFETAEAAFGPRDGALLVGRAAALLRAVRREGGDLRLLPPPCRFLSPGEADLLAALRARLSRRRPVAEDASAAVRAALSDLAAPILPALSGLPVLPPAAPGPMARPSV